MRKAVLMVDSSKESEEAKELLDKANIPYVIYKIDDPRLCCGGLEVKVPSLYTPEGIFRGIEGVKEYIKIADPKKESESAYW